MCHIRSEGWRPRFDLGWRLRGRSDPDARPDIKWSPAEAPAVIAWHREAAALEAAKKQVMTTLGKGSPKASFESPADDDDSVQKQIRSAVKQTLQAKHQGPGAGAQRRRGNLRPGRDLDRAGPAHSGALHTRTARKSKLLTRNVQCSRVRDKQGRGKKAHVRAEARVPRAKRPVSNCSNRDRRDHPFVVQGYSESLATTLVGQRLHELEA